MKAINLKMSAILVATFLAGCVGEVRIENMTITNQEALKYTESTPLTDNISVESVFINEGKDQFETTSKKFREALVTSLEIAKLLAHDDKGLYKLKGHIVRSDPGNFSHLVAVQYTLTQKHNGKEIYTKLISSTGKGTFGDTWAYQYEEAIKNNISILIGKLYKLKMEETDG